MKIDVTAVLLAAGKGERFGAERNKVYTDLAGSTVLSRSASPFLQSPLVEEVILVVAAGEEGLAEEISKQAKKPTQIVRGGAARRDSALAGVRAAKGQIVLIHDAARPFVSVRLINATIDGARSHGACVPVIPEADTIRRLNGEAFTTYEPIERRSLVRIQTPQAFKRELIEQALDSDNAQYPDDAAALLARGIPVWATPGETANIKITSSDDLIIAEALAAKLFGSESQA